MATLGASVFTLADIAKTWDPDGSPARIVELLNQRNEVLEDMLWKEGNLPAGHRTTVRTGLPTSFWRLANQGVAPSKSTTAQFDEQCGILEQWSEIDVVTAEFGGNPEAVRFEHGKTAIESLNQEFVQTLFYGNTGTAPEEYLGLAVRYNSTTASESGKNIILGGGSGADNSSIWLVGWGEQTVFGIYPKGAKAGIEHEDMGKVTVETTAGVAGNRMRAYQDRWGWKCGVTVADWRAVVRIANIDISNLVAESSNAVLWKLMTKAIHKIPVAIRRMSKLVFYMNRTVFQMLDIQRRNDVSTGGQLTYEVVDGVERASFRGIPIKIVDQLLETEAVIA